MYGVIHLYHAVHGQGGVYTSEAHGQPRIPSFKSRLHQDLALCVEVYEYKCGQHRERTGGLGHGHSVKARTAVAHNERSPFHLIGERASYLEERSMLYDHA